MPSARDAVDQMRDERPREALSELLALGRRANQFFDSEAPWNTRKEDMGRTRATLYACAVMLQSIAFHAAPYVPEAIEALGDFFDGPAVPVPDAEDPADLPERFKVSGSKPLFRRIEDGEVLAAEQQLADAATGGEES